MKVFRIVLVGAGRGRRIEFQSREIQFSESHFAGVEAHDRVVADSIEELAAVFLSGSKFVFISQGFEQSYLLVWRKPKKLLTMQTLAV